MSQHSRASDPSLGASRSAAPPSAGGGGRLRRCARRRALGPCGCRCFGSADAQTPPSKYPRTRHEGDRRRRRHDDAPAPPLHAQSLISLYGATSAVAPAGDRRSSPRSSTACTRGATARATSRARATTWPTRRRSSATARSCTLHVRDALGRVRRRTGGRRVPPPAGAVGAARVVPRAGGGDLWRLDFSRTRNFTLEAWVRPGALLGVRAVRAARSSRASTTTGRASGCST